MTKPTTNRTLGSVFLFLAVFLFGYIGQAQTLGSLYIEDSSKQLDIEEGASLKSALEEVEKHYNVGILYRANIVEGLRVRQASKLPLKLEEALPILLEETDLKFKYLNPKTYGIYKNTRIIPQELESVQQNVTGTVTDAQTGESLPGVNIAIEGTSTGTVTDENGEYSLEVADSDAVLVFSFVGYQTQRIEVLDQEVINVSLELDLGLMDEVIVVGYGTVERSDLTGSVQRVNSETFQSQSMTQLTDMLTGTIAGFNANQGTSSAGGSSLEVRGPNSLTAGTEPLIVLDGVIYNGSLRDINPNDIETIDVLKDASSAAVFGAKAASGVILITTSKGQRGAPTINLSTSISSSDVTNKNIRPLNSEEYKNFRRDLLILENPDSPDYFYHNPKELPSEINLEEWRGYSSNPDPDNSREWLNRLLFTTPEIENYTAGRTENWYDRVMQSGIRQNYDLSLSGGTEDIGYYFSLGHTDNEGIIAGDEFSTVRSRLNIDADVAGFLKIGLNSQFSRRDQSAVPAHVGRMLNQSPYGTAFDEEGNLNWFPNNQIQTRTPLDEYLYQDRSMKINSFFGSLYAEISLPFGIYHRVSFQPRIESFREYDYWSPQTINGGQNVSDGVAQRRDFTMFEWMVDNLLKWDREFGEHRFDITLLHSVEENRSWNSFMQNNTFSPSPILGYGGLQFGNNPSIESNDRKVTGDALMGRVNYTLLQKYLFTFSLRRDGYSAFGQEQPRATFPAAAFAWQISEESFFNIDWMNQLKLRLSWGVNGNRDIGAYSALAQLSSNLYSDGSRQLMGVYNSSLANTSLAWEETEAFNIGLDISLFQDRINASIDVYDMTTTNLLMNRNLPQITGFNNVTANLGELENRGFEFTLNSVNVSSADFSWSSNFVFSLNRNEIKRLFGDIGEYTLINERQEGELPDFGNEWFPGQAIDVVWDYDIIGVWQENEAEEAAVYGARPGDYKAVDINGDGNYTALADKQFIGHRQPRYRLGLRNEFSYKNFSASMFIRSDLGHVGSINIFRHPGSNSYDRRGNRAVPYWTADNPSNDYGSLAPTAGIYGGGYGIYFSRSFVRIQDVSLSYSLPASIANQFPLRDLRIYGSVRNLYTFDKWENWDPESGGSPMPRIFTIGLDVSI